jgi:hypothetical protein
MRAPLPASRRIFNGSARQAQVHESSPHPGRETKQRVLVTLVYACDERIL